MHDVARDEHVTAAYIYVLLRLGWIAPDITTAIVSGQHPPQLSAKKLMRMTAHLPTDWTEQRALLDFGENKSRAIAKLRCKVLSLLTQQRRLAPERVNHGMAAERYSRAKQA